MERSRKAALVGARELLDDDGSMQKIAAGPAVFFGQPRAQEARLAGLLEDVAVDHALLDPALLVGLHFARDELDQSLAKQLVLFGKKRALHGGCLPRLSRACPRPVPARRAESITRQTVSSQKERGYAQLPCLESRRGRVH